MEIIMLGQVKKRLLHTSLREMGSAAVALSGGIDSTLLAKVAQLELGNRALALTAVSPSLARTEREDSRLLAREIGIRQVEIETRELEDRKYAANPGNRCYFCKKELFTVAAREARRLGYRWVLEGTHSDDLGGHRPGYRAAVEEGVRSPYVEAGYTKEDIRDHAQDLGLSNWDKPSLACLSSRFPTGTEITAERLRQIEDAEIVLRRNGARQCRARYHGDTIRIELSESEMGLAGESGFREKVRQGCATLGFRHVTMDLIPYGIVVETTPLQIYSNMDQLKEKIKSRIANEVAVFPAGDLLRIGLAREDIAKLPDNRFRLNLVRECRRAGFRHVTVDFSVEGE